jgi:hypothetical protein
VFVVGVVWVGVVLGVELVDAGGGFGFGFGAGARDAVLVGATVFVLDGGFDEPQPLVAPASASTITAQRLIGLDCVLVSV